MSLYHWNITGCRFVFSLNVGRLLEETRLKSNGRTVEIAWMGRLKNESIRKDRKHFFLRFSEDNSIRRQSLKIRFWKWPLVSSLLILILPVFPRCKLLFEFLSNSLSVTTFIKNYLSVQSINLVLKGSLTTNSN